MFLYPDCLLYSCLHSCLAIGLAVCLRALLLCCIRARQMCRGIPSSIPHLVSVGAIGAQLERAAQRPQRSLKEDSVPLRLSVCPCSGPSCRSRPILTRIYLYCRRGRYSGAAGLLFDAAQADKRSLTAPASPVDYAARAGSPAQNWCPSQGEGHGGNAADLCPGEPARMRFKFGSDYGSSVHSREYIP